MAESYDHMAGSPIDPDTMSFKDGSQASPAMSQQDAILAEQARMSNQSASEQRYNDVPAQPKKSKKKK